MIPLYGSKYTMEEVLYKTADLTNNLKIEKKCVAYLKVSQAELLKFFEKDFSEKGIEKIKEAIKVKRNFLYDLMEEELDKEFEEEKNKLKLEISKSMLENNCTKEQIINSTKITEEQFLTL